MCELGDMLEEKTLPQSSCRARELQALALSLVLNSRLRQPGGFSLFNELHLAGAKSKASEEVEPADPWGIPRIKCWADATDDEDEQILRGRPAAKPRPKRIYSRRVLLQARPRSSGGGIGAEAALPVARRTSVVETRRRRPAEHFFDPASAESTFEAVLAWLEPDARQRRVSFAAAQAALPLPEKSPLRAGEAALEEEASEDVVGEATSDGCSGNFRWPWVMIWALLLLLSYFWAPGAQPAVQAARPGVSFAPQ
ncbi:unnamed protein product [Effrenium voratum]|uniref:Uncharacterized protein n=1 Tax=Effrenium voratum TaxID=2562239 RepID=A0AA36J0I0_9DINO|nr:unnamed protein product [Effrenium voratum]